MLVRQLREGGSLWLFHPVTNFLSRCLSESTDAWIPACPVLCVKSCCVVPQPANQPVKAWLTALLPPQPKANGDAVKAKEDAEAAAAEKPPPLLEAVRCLAAAWRGAAAETAAKAGTEVAEALTVPLEPGKRPCMPFRSR